MATYRVDWSEKKNNDWVLASLLDETGNKLSEVSINRTSKKGEIFPNFDEIRPGAEIKGELWTSTANKNYLFPPRKKLEPPNFIKNRAMPKVDVEGHLAVQQQITKNVKAAQDRTAWMWAKNNASEILSVLYKNTNQIEFDFSQLEELATKIYNMEPTEPF